MAAHQAPPSLGFSRQEHWSGLPSPSPVHESEKWKWSHSVVFNSQWPHGLQPTRLFCPWGFLGKSTVMGCHCLCCCIWLDVCIKLLNNLLRFLQFTSNSFVQKSHNSLTSHPETCTQKRIPFSFPISWMLSPSSSSSQKDESHSWYQLVSHLPH